MAPAVFAQEAETEKAIEKYRQMMKQDPWSNPGLLDADRGEALWTTPRGPNKISLEHCDLGRGPGKVDGVFAELPRYFIDADRVMDVETRLMWCMEKLQGFSHADLVIGTGAVAAAGNTLTVNYKGWLYDASRADQKGALFDSSYEANRTPFTFALGVGSVIAGWDQGLVGMQEGGVRRLVVPPSLGYGTSRHGPIPPGATLIFDCVAVDVQPS